VEVTLPVTTVQAKEQGTQWNAAWNAFLPFLVRFNPDAIVFSAGFDGHKDDLSGLLQIKQQVATRMRRCFQCFSNNLARVQG
jgi:acetoin utilization deacetylase AcuC-like enzyme